MREEVKNAMKNAIKAAIPEGRIVAAIMKAEALKGQAVDKVKDQKSRLTLAVETIINKLPFPISLIVRTAKDVVVEAVTEAVQEEFDVIKSELQREGVVSFI